MRSEIGVGIIGCGSVARWKYVKNLAEMSGVSLRAFYGGRAEEFQQQYGAPGSVVCRDLAEFLAREDVDAVCICTPNNSHAEIALAALRARKHVLCEKPMAISAEDAVRMVETAEQMGVLLTVGHQSRFSPAAQALYHQLREGAFGSLYFARASMVRRMGIPTWGHFFDPAVQGGGCLIDLGTHALDLALWLLNDFSPAYCCAGIFRGPGDSPTPANRWGTWDPAMLRTETGAFGQVVLQSGTVLSLDISWALHVPEDREETVTLCGTAAGAAQAESVRHSANRRGKSFFMVRLLSDMPQYSDTYTKPLYAFGRICQIKMDVFLRIRTESMPVPVSAGADGTVRGGNVDLPGGLILPGLRGGRWPQRSAG